MTIYTQKIQNLKSTFYKNQGQIDAIISVKNYIDVNYESDLNMDLISKIKLISKFHLIRLFKKYYGLTPRQYLIDKRIEKSKEHLAEGLTVSKTCYAVGFSSVGSFSALFKSKTGKTPVQYQKEQLSRNNLIQLTSSLGE